MWNSIGKQTVADAYNRPKERSYDARSDCSRCSTVSARSCAVPAAGPASNYALPSRHDHRSCVVGLHSRTLPMGVGLICERRGAAVGVSARSGSLGELACPDNFFYRHRSRLNGHRPALYRHRGIEPTSMSFNSKLEPMKNIVQCQKHGAQEAAPVCCHLASSLSTEIPVGFYYSGTVAERSDAWCSECEEVRVQEGGDSGDWNEASESFARITLVCGACYDRIAEIARL